VELFDKNPDGLRELLPCDAILESSVSGAWVNVKEAET